MVDIQLLEHCVREELNETALRAMAVLDPVKVVLTNYPEGKSEELPLENHPGHEEMGMRSVTFSRNLYIEREDFMENPPPKFFRLKPGSEVRLKGAYIIRCDEVIKDADDNISELRCSYDPESKSGDAGRKVKGTLHWVEEGSSVPAEVRFYDLLFSDSEGEDLAARLNADSCKTMSGCLLEGGLASVKPGERYQFMRQGYFICDKDSQPGTPAFNRIVGLKDSWAKEMNKSGE
jgi:glutaminyl-tRNA synthetase